MEILIVASYYHCFISMGIFWDTRRRLKQSIHPLPPFLLPCSTPLCGTREAADILYISLQILQTLYFTIAFLNDIMGTNAQTAERPPIRKIKDNLFVIAYNLAMYVSFTFWSLYIINKDWIITEEVEKLYPPILNHVFHTTVSIFMFIEILMPYKTYPPRFIGHVFILTFVTIYAIWFFIVFAKFGVGIYPLFNYINWPARILFLFASIAIVTFFYNISEALNDFVATKKNYKDVTKYIKRL